ncbi:ankyrin repeat domain-containing protein [Flavobacterium sp.]|uniref:ankyrin repeat domain-containing protein n=1 Tax=Flavobacterium sp. TaxID=239 RepID=UPI00286EA3FD|nr:ankyrin repeat domain-containing protein [Flavobacterium sp.]
MNYKYCLIVFLLFLNCIHSQEISKNIYDIARKGSVAEAKELIVANPKIVLEANKDGFTALVLATYRGNNEVAKLLIESGADINSSSSMGSPLMAAVVKGNNEIAKILLEKKANPNLADANGMTALIYAVQFQNVEILDLLLKYNANKSHKDKQGKTAFEYAAFSGNEKIINKLKLN